VARLRSIRAASACDARGRSSHNTPVVGSSPTRPTDRTIARTGSVPALAAASFSPEMSMRGAVLERQVVVLDGGLFGLDLGQDRAVFGAPGSVAVTMPRSGTDDCADR
jgi:hypothetical protein